MLSVRPTELGRGSVEGPGAKLPVPQFSSEADNPNIASTRPQYNRLLTLVRG